MSFLDKLRDEVIETQRIQATFARWKLALIAVLGGAAIGIPPSQLKNESWALLGLLPFVCVYADSLVYNSGIRVLAIAQYLRSGKALEIGAPPEGTRTGSDAQDWEIVRNYERFLKDRRRDFNLEVPAFRGTTLGVSLIVLVLGALGFVPRSIIAISIPQRIWLMMTGLSGAVLGQILYSRHCRKVDLVDECD
jgi:hypothetical protein